MNKANNLILAKQSTLVLRDGTKRVLNELSKTDLLEGVAWKKCYPFLDYNIPGVYMLIENGEVAYVGSSKNIQKRLSYHHIYDQYIHDAYVVRVDNENVRMALEEIAVRVLAPKLNQIVPVSNLFWNEIVSAEINLTQEDILYRAHNPGGIEVSQTKPTPDKEAMSIFVWSIEHNGGKLSISDVSKKGYTFHHARQFLDFWQAQGYLTGPGQGAARKVVPSRVSIETEA
jgi:hypothetical protein